MLYRAKEHLLHLEDAQIDYITFGRGEKPLVMIQGLSTRGLRGTAPLLACLYRIFAKDYIVYLFDRRRQIKDGVTVRDLAADTAAAMDALKLKQADVIGVSQGGMIAQYLALERPDLVNKLVLAVTLSRNNATVEAVIRHWIALAEQNRMQELIADMAEKMYSGTNGKKYRLLLPLLTALQKPRDVARFVTLAKACLTCDTYGELEKLRCPVFVIGGRLDRVVGAEASEEIARKLGCKLRIYETLGHAVYEEAADFNHSIYDFLREPPTPTCGD